MEIITHVGEGAITHEDKFGNRGRAMVGDVQVMSAGTGIVYSQYNREARDDVAIADVDSPG
ncbi:pirin family protein [Xanthobacter sediminis]